MEYIYAAMLIHKLGGHIDASNVKKVIEAAGGTPDEGKIKALVVALKGVDIEKTIKEAASIAPAATHTKEVAEHKEEHKEEVKVDEGKAAAGLGALFG